ncbi:hypothetical protein B0H14DRAFT_2568232 [Mycena olivaceomarginata]|nr:hypothetical protein B0H14DRAFT_2568232 [Mycena olivaceomarginata]
MIHGGIARILMLHADIARILNEFVQTARRLVVAIFLCSSRPARSPLTRSSEDGVFTSTFGHQGLGFNAHNLQDTRMMTCSSITAQRVLLYVVSMILLQFIDIMNLPFDLDGPMPNVRCPNTSLCCLAIVLLDLHAQSFWCIVPLLLDLCAAPFSILTSPNAALIDIARILNEFLPPMALEWVLDKAPIDLGCCRLSVHGDIFGFQACSPTRVQMKHQLRDESTEPRSHPVLEAGESSERVSTQIVHSSEEESQSSTFHREGRVGRNQRTGSSYKSYTRIDGQVTKRYEEARKAAETRATKGGRSRSSLSQPDIFEAEQEGAGGM